MAVTIEPPMRTLAWRCENVQWAAEPVQNAMVGAAVRKNGLVAVVEPTKMLEVVVVWKSVPVAAKSVPAVVMRRLTLDASWP